MAKRHPGARKARQQSRQHEPDDVFLARVLHLGKWAEANQQALTVLGIVVAIVIAGLVYYRNYRSGLYLQAAEQLEAVYQTLSIDDTEGARDQLVTFLERFEGTPYESEARLLLGDLYLRDDSPQQAMVVLRPLGESPREPIEFQAAALLAVAYEEDGRWSEAEDVYLTIADRSELDFEVRDALGAAARIRTDQGDPQGAIELYERLLDEADEDAPQRGLYDMRIEEIRSGLKA